MCQKKKDKLGTLVFKDILSKEVLIWKHLQSELTKDYKQLLKRLLDIGYTVKAIIIDGKRGLFKAFTHQKLVSAYKSLRTNLPYLFTYKNHKEYTIHNTTNAIDGGVFSPMKKLLKYTMDLLKV